MTPYRLLLCCTALASGAPRPLVAQAPENCCSADVLANGLRIAREYRVAAIATRRFTHADYWTAVEPSLASGELRVAEVGRSLQDRALRAVSFGDGPVRVLLWSQMHGDESTASMALADIFRFLAEGGSDPLRVRLRRALTITLVPMLNPDGAELFQRQNAAGIDVNRDARQLATPEGRALSALHEQLQPAFGFNLHDQIARTRAGARGLQAAIALLAPAFDATGRYHEGRSRARLVAAGIATLLTREIPGRVARYDETFGPRAFGDEFQRRGTSTVLIESGALPGDPEKQRLRALNVAALLGALDAIGTGSYRRADAAVYSRLPANQGGAQDLLVLGGQLVLPGTAPLRADVAVNYGDAVAQTNGRIADVGDLRESIGIDTLNATGLFLHPADSALRTAAGAAWLRVGGPATFELRRGADPASALAGRVPADARDRFFDALARQCGARFEGAMTFPADPRHDFAGKRLVAQVASCTDSEIRVPFLVGEDRSRTWIISRAAGGLQLKHDHRHADGTPDSVTMYGGPASTTGSALAQSFGADAHTTALIPAAATNVWTVTLSADGASLTYHLERESRPRFTAVLTRVR